MFGLVEIVMIIAALVAGGIAVYLWCRATRSYGMWRNAEKNADADKKGK